MTLTTKKCLLIGLMTCLCAVTQNASSAEISRNPSRTSKIYLKYDQETDTQQVFYKKGLSQELKLTNSAEEKTAVLFGEKITAIQITDQVTGRTDLCQNGRIYYYLVEKPASIQTEDTYIGCIQANNVGFSGYREEDSVIDWSVNLEDHGQEAGGSTLETPASDSTYNQNEPEVPGQYNETPSVVEDPGNDPDSWFEQDPSNPHNPEDYISNENGTENGTGSGNGNGGTGENETGNVTDSGSGSGSGSQNDPGLVTENGSDGPSSDTDVDQPEDSNGDENGGLETQDPFDTKDPDDSGEIKNNDPDQDDPWNHTGDSGDSFDGDQSDDTDPSKPGCKTCSDNPKGNDTTGGFDADNDSDKPDWSDHPQSDIVTESESPQDFSDEVSSDSSLPEQGENDIDGTPHLIMSATGGAFSGCSLSTQPLKNGTMTSTWGLFCMALFCSVFFLRRKTQ